MALEINNLTGGSIQGTGESNRSGTQTGQTSTGTTSAAPGAGADRVSLTSSATQLQALEEKISSLPVVDAQRVEETRHALATGNHEVDPVSTAEGVLEVERSFATQET